MITPAWRTGLEHAIARAYALGYDAVVEGFAPYEALREEVAGYVRRSAPPGATVLDVACGIGNVCLHLGRLGYQVRGFDAVGTLIDVARAKQRASGLTNVWFDELDIARTAPPGAGELDSTGGLGPRSTGRAVPAPSLRASPVDVLVSMNTLYWHPDPQALLRGCRAAVKRDGHAVFVTYGRRARVVRTCREVRAAQGSAAALRALRWLVPTAAFELVRDFEPRYLDQRELHAMLSGAGFDVLEDRTTFLAGLCRLVWTRVQGG